MTMSLLLKFAYLGTEFDGYSQQRGKKTIEGEILNVLKYFNIASTLKSSSRTDRGVSALGNVIKINTSTDVSTVFGILNAHLEHIYFYKYAHVPETFNPRIAVERWYRYYFYDKGYNFAEMQKSLNLFIGTHDFSRFCRKDRRLTVRTINNVKIAKVRKLYILDIKGESFLWNMIRRIVGAIQLIGLNKLRAEEVERALRGESIRASTAPPENLVLMDVKYHIKFKNLYLQKKALYKKTEIEYVKFEFYKSLLARSR